MENIKFMISKIMVIVGHGRTARDFCACREFGDLITSMHLATLGPVKLFDTVCQGTSYPNLYNELLYKMGYYLLPGHMVKMGALIFSFF